MFLLFFCSTTFFIDLIDSFRFLLILLPLLSFVRCTPAWRTISVHYILFIEFDCIRIYVWEAYTEADYRQVKDWIYFIVFTVRKSVKFNRRKMSFYLLLIRINKFNNFIYSRGRSVWTRTLLRDKTWLIKCLEVFFLFLNKWRHSSAPSTPAVYSLLLMCHFSDGFY